MNPKRRFLAPYVIIGVLMAFLIAVPVLAQQGPPPFPHSPDAKLDCVACHSTGVAGSPKFPTDHAGRTNEVCKGCHQAAPKASGTPSGPAASSAPKIPHPLQGRDNCLTCHATGTAGAPKMPSSHAGRTSDQCRSCHKTVTEASGEVVQVAPTPIPNVPPTAADKDSCVTCHTSQTGALNEPVKQWQSSIHSERNVRCVNCHGGDATKPTKEEAHSTKSGYIGKPLKVDIPALCASCHSNNEAMRQYDLPTDQWSKFQQSTHGIKLAQADMKVPTCFTCHDGHATKKTNDPTANVYSMNVPALCSSCHSNADYMKPYGIPTNQFALYVKSVHGQALLEKQDTRAPSCATCHGTHGAAPPGFAEVANVCGSCHTATQNYFLQSKHAGNQPGMPKCVDCHGRYDVMKPTDALLDPNSKDPRACATCHPPTSPQTNAVKALYDNITGSAKSMDLAHEQLKVAAEAALITEPDEGKMAVAQTNLVTARAAQHTLDLTVVKEKTDKAVSTSNEVIADAKKAIDESGFRRQIMIIGLVIMALSIASLYVIRRELYKQLPPE
ncbi:MAG: cytochrome c3 family protein [Chloroflexi bacterium]|nr:cytochrome c3 family protein [Chloroflexota bacterium]